MKLKMGLEYSDKTSYFEPKRFLQSSLETFSRAQSEYRYLKDVLNVALDARKRIMRHKHHISFAKKDSILK